MYEQLEEIKEESKKKDKRKSNNLQNTTLKHEPHDNQFMCSGRVGSSCSTIST